MLVIRDTAPRRIMVVRSTIEIREMKTAMYNSAPINAGVQWMVRSSKGSASGEIRSVATKNWIA